MSCVCSDCSFLGKTLNAERAGALAAIIMDDDIENDQFMVDMIQDETDRSTNIPAFFLLGKDGYGICVVVFVLVCNSALSFA